MDEQLIKSDILLLCADILMGKAKDAEIKRVTKLAVDNGMGAYLRDEFISVGLTITSLRNSDYE